MHSGSVRLACALTLFVVACETPDPAGRRPLPPVQAPANAPPPVPLEAQAKELLAGSKPGREHQALEPLLGEWDVSLSTVSPDGTESEPFRGHATLAWILGGRFLRWDANVDFAGVPGTTTGFLGFDARSRRYQLMMISDLATGMEIARGGGDLRGTGLVLELEQVDARTGNRLLARSRLRSLSSDHFVLEQLEGGAEGKDRTVRVWHYRRATHG
jgi:Protein of unknown function (DUF1579)